MTIDDEPTSPSTEGPLPNGPLDPRSPTERDGDRVRRALRKRVNEQINEVIKLADEWSESTDQGGASDKIYRQKLADGLSAFLNKVGEAGRDIDKD